MKKERKLISLIAFFLLAGCVVCGRFLLPRWLTYDHLSILSWDVFGYYLYLPAQFIYHDIGINDFSWLQSILDKYSPTIGFYQAYQGPEGDYIMKYPMGMAILFAPFFFIAHLLAGLLGFAADGFSLPYQVSIAMGTLVYAIIGIWFLRKILLAFFTDRVTVIVMVLVILGTNYFQLTAYDGAIVHNALFTIYTLIIWFTIRWHETPKWRYAIPLGLLVGFATLIRPTEIISALIPVFWCIYNRDSLKRKWLLVKSHWSQVTVMVIMVLLVGFLQLIYWKLHAGTWIYYSYEEGEQLKFLDPNFINVVFSWKKGWLIYAPMMAFPLIGFIFLYRRNLKIFWTVCIFFAVNLLIVSAWTTWWYGGSLGQRSMMQSYAIMALPFGAFITWLLARKIWVKAAFTVIALFFIWLNLFQTWQYMTWIIDPSRMTKDYYWAIFGRTHVDESKRKMLEPVESFDREYLDDGIEYERRILAFFDFENDGGAGSPNLTDEASLSGMYAMVMNSATEYSPGIKRSFKEIAPSDGSWIRMQVSVYPLFDMHETPANVVITMNGNDGNYKYKSIALEEEQLKVGEWNVVTMDYELPYVSDEEDMVTAYVWNRGTQGVFYIDDIRIDLLELKQD